MISRLINMDIPYINTNPEPIKSINNGAYSIEDYARAFINGMGETQKERFKKMLENNMQCGMSVAENYGVNYDDFINEVRKQMGV